MTDLRLTDAQTAHAAGDITTAERGYRAILHDDPANTAALQGLGVLCLQTRRAEAAITYLQRVVDTGPASATLWHNLAVALAAVRRIDDAVTAFHRTLALEPDAVSTLQALGELLVANGRPSEALPLFTRAAILEPGSARLHCALGEVFGALERHEDAVACFEKARDLAPDNAVIANNLGTALTFLGRLDEARCAYGRAVELAPDVPTFRYAALAQKAATPDDADFLALRRMATQATRFPPSEQAALHIALAKAYDDQQEFEAAFAHMHVANALKRRLIAYDERRELSRLDAIAEMFTRDYLAAYTGKGDPSDVPVFIIGMPRSGTSLVEQILASHRQVHGAGERLYLAELAGADFPAVKDWFSIGRAYGEKLRALAPEARRVTDKLPGNFLYAGLITLALPQAKIIHVRRNPMDTCLSCFSKFFSGQVPYAYDLGELGRYYRAYEKLMTHWRDVLPQDRLLEVDYEKVVGDLENEARRLIDFCGLEWDARCLDFHAAKRSVSTASTLQVRRPLYKTAMGRANHYTPWLASLRAALEGSVL